MRILQLHSDFIEYEPVKKETANAEKTEKKPYRFEDVLVILTSVEKGDDATTAKDAIDEVAKFAKTMKIGKMVLYPYAHLSSNLADPDTALHVMKKMEEFANSTGMEIHRAPFGWAKKFSISVKGHPLAEHSRRISKMAEEAVQVLVNPSHEKHAKKDEKTIEEKKAVMFRQAKVSAEDLPENDHRIIGQKMDLYSFHDAAPGMPFFHSNGMIVINELLKFWKEEHRKAGYQEVRTPIILNRQLWEISGHWDKYKENMYFTKIDEEDYAVKPMNCPGGILIFKSKTHSYRDLPIRMAELGLVHRHELSGVLNGLFRVRTFTQDDAHIFCREDQIKDEILGVIHLITNFYKTFGFEYHLELSTRPEKSIGSDAQWEAAEKGLKDALETSGIKYKLNPGDGAFYGPKIDFHVKDSQGRTWQCGTIQLDMTMPDKFDLDYTAEDNKPRKVVMIHRTLMGSIERFLGILVEHFSGKFPLWLAPIQAEVIPISETNNKYAKQVTEEMRKAGIRADAKIGENTMDYKIRDAQVRKVPFMIVLGDREEKEKNVSVRSREGKIEFKVNTHDFIRRVQESVEQKNLTLN
jgi:threonyl-tRNA synthetase